MIVAVTRGEWIFVGVVAFFAVLLVLTLWRVSIQPKTRGWRLGLYFERDINEEDPADAETAIWPSQEKPNE